METGTIKDLIAASWLVTLGQSGALRTVWSPDQGKGLAWEPFSLSPPGMLFGFRFTGMLPADERTQPEIGFLNMVDFAQKLTGLR